MTVSQRDRAARNGLFSFLIFVGIVLLLWLVVWPAYQEIGKTQAEIRAAEQQRDDRAKAVKDINALLAAYSDKKSQLTPLDQALPASPAIPQLLADIETIARQSAMKIDSLKLTDAPSTAETRQAGAKTKPSAEQFFKTPELVRLKIDLRVTGSFEHALLLLDVLERNARLFDIQSLGIESGSPSQSPATGEGKFSFLITTYYLKSQ